MVVPLVMGLSKCPKFNITMIKNDMDEDEAPPPFITIQLVLQERLESCAFIDSRADGNTVSYELFKTLKDAHFKDINAMFQLYTSHTAQALGMCNLELNFSELVCRDKFFVTLPRHSTNDEGCTDHS